jgi:hypothetical protein
MKEFIAEAKSRYDFVFFDSPPIMGVSDASILASEVDMAVLVVQYRKYPQQMTLRAKQMVEKVGGHLLGVVLNNINISQDSYYYYYSGYYYDYYSKSEDSKPEGERKLSKKKKADAKPAESIGRGRESAGELGPGGATVGALEQAGVGAAPRRGCPRSHRHRCALAKSAWHQHQCTVVERWNPAALRGGERLRGHCGAACDGQGERRRFKKSQALTSPTSRSRPELTRTSHG